MNSIAAFASKLVNRKEFRFFIFFLILFSAGLVGIETYSNIALPHKNLLHLLDQVVVGCFVVEISLKILSHGRKPLDYFRDPWNIFDFIIVAVCLIPAVDTHFVAVLRIARILRVLRMISLLPKLQLLIGALLKSIPSMAYVIILLALLFYIYGIIGSFLFGKSDPLHFGNLHLSLITLFKVLTLEGWTEILNVHLYEPGQAQSDSVEITSIWPLIYFISFILIGAMIVMNLFIGVIMNSMEESQRELEQRIAASKSKDRSTEMMIRSIEFKIDELKKEISGLKNRL
jgi:voltage-gated sodium channel